MPKKISFSLSETEIRKALNELNRYKQWVKQKTDMLTERLAVLGAGEASIRFARAYYDGINDVSIEVSPIDNGWKVTASGEAVCFIEFGAGVYFNGTEPYPVPRPPGVSGIGEYGQGKGKQNTWGYYNESGELTLTHGTPAAMPMYHAGRAVEREVARIAREVFRA